MIRKIVVVLALIIIAYVATLHLFGQSSLYDTALDFVIEKESTNRKTVDFSHEISVALKSHETFLKDHTFDKRYKDLKFIDSEEGFKKMRELKKPVIVIIKSGIGVPFGLADIGINIVKGDFTTVYYGKKYLWCFLSWIDLKGYEEFSTPY